MAKNPDLADRISALRQHRDEASKDNYNQTIAALAGASDPARQQEIIAGRIQYGIDNDIPMMETTRSLNQLVGQPEEFNKALGLEIATTQSKAFTEQWQAEQGLVDDGGKIGTYNPRDYTTKSWAKFRQSKKPDDLERYTEKTIDIGGVQYRRIPGTINEYEPIRTTGEVAASKSEIAAAVRKEEAKASRQSKAEGKAMDSYEAALEGSYIYDEALAALADNASPSRMASWTPTLRASTARLEAAGNRLALNLLKTVTMGALSKSEMDILQQTVMPKMEPEALKKWLIARQAAERKIADLYLEAANAYAKGETRAEFFTRKKEESEGKDTKTTRVWGEK